MTSVCLFDVMTSVLGAISAKRFDVNVVGSSRTEHFLTENVDISDSY